MKTNINHYFTDKVSLAGFCLIIISAILFAVTGHYGHMGGGVFGTFAAHYVVAIGFTIAVCIKTMRLHRWNLSAGKAEHTAMLLVIWFISAFALNRELNVFDDSSDWLSIWIVLSVAALLLAVRHQILVGFARYLVFFLLGGALLLFIYYACYLFQLYILSLIGIIALGISLHTYIPLCLAILTGSMIIKAAREDKAVLYSAVAGFALPLFIAIAFLFFWGSAIKDINQIINKNTLNEGKLPAWIAVSRDLEASPVTERIMKAGLVYHEVIARDNFFLGGVPSKSFDAKKEHDPLVVLATLLFERPNLDENDRINILKAMFDARHQAQDRLWSGDKLQTISVISNVKLYPEYRLAYTEKTLTIRNNANWEWSNQEAIYTFHMPEGSVVSSLSLWMNGKEEKSRLTTKAKADTAYQTIVGIEQHDPSVVHWQEGNTVSVRIFPCTPAENRKFKVGITSPLRLDGPRLVYQNAWFDGPQATTAMESLQLNFAGKAADLQLPSLFRKTGSDIYTADRTYDPEWEISCTAPDLAQTAFTFANTFYVINKYEQQEEAFTPGAVYLDVNKAWTKDEFKTVFNGTRSHAVYVYYDKLLQVKDNNIDSLFDLLHQQNFSLFPLSEIRHPETALLITKSNGESPNLTDLEGSAFATELTAYLTTPHHIRLYSIGNSLSPYIKALKELRVFSYASGNQEQLLTLLNKDRFISNQENDSTVVLDNAGIMIRKAPGAVAAETPDHLLRLFAYNDIMKKVGPDYFRHDYVQPKTIAEAEQAYVVSPVSSMIVLETVKDYERFGIEENKNSLKNASMKSSGAVPEPQEWVLIILAAGIVATFIYRGRRAVPQL